jgi:hypothetical protein
MLLFTIKHVCIYCMLKQLFLGDLADNANLHGYTTCGKVVNDINLNNWLISQDIDPWSCNWWMDATSPPLHALKYNDLAVDLLLYVCCIFKQDLTIFTAYFVLYIAYHCHLSLYSKLSLKIKRTLLKDYNLQNTWI